MAKGDVPVSLTGLQCSAADWWLRERYIPFALERWRATKDPAHVRDFTHAAKLLHRFARAANRQCDDVPASRKLPREAAWWFGAMPDAIALGDAPAVMPDGVNELPCADALAALPSAAAHEAMFACRATMRRYLYGHRAPQRGPAPRQITQEEVAEAAARSQGHDKRHWEKRKAQAKRDEVQARIDAEWARKLSELWARRL